MELRERKCCPLCGSESIMPFKKGTVNPAALSPDDFKITDSHYGSLWHFSRCDGCGFVFSNPYLPEEAITAFYSRLEDSEYCQEAEGRGKNFKTILKRLRKLGAGDTLLDIGAAGGIFTDLARRGGFGAQGIEPSSYLVAEARQRFGIELFQGTLGDFKRDPAGRGKTFDVVALLDIIEHLVEPDAFMGELDDLVADNGLLVLVTPDVGSLAARIMGRRWWHYRIAHINFFNRRSLRYLLEKHGYEIVLTKKYVWNFSLFYLLTRIFPPLKKNKPLQNVLKGLHLKLPLFDSWEIYAAKRTQ